ncbi:MAG: putative sulfate exporter family transporter [Chloroflexi bacterium]|nr:putative sulfate exporter family transporter [Chloroflexota bacterium]
MVGQAAQRARVRTSSLLENALLGVPLSQVPRLMPGVAMAVVVVIVAIVVADALNRALGFSGAVSSIMVAIILGMIVRNTVGVPRWALPGIDFCLRRLLRLGIIFMGIRLSIFDALKIGAWGVPIVVLCVIAGLAVTSYVTQRLGLSRRLGTLIAVGTSICGASAIVATAPGIKARSEEVAYAVANITVFGVVAMLLYPFLANFLFTGNLIMSGLFLGTAVHETAQVAGAGLIYDQTFPTAARPTAADVAVVTKLVRNMFMALVIPFMVYLYARNAGADNNSPRKVNVTRLVPLFIFAFLALAVVRSIGDAGLQGDGLAFGLWGSAAWHQGTRFFIQLSGHTLAAAMAGVGLGTSYSALKGLGIKPFFVGLLAALIVGAASFVAVMVLGPRLAV